jgi:hypothetical protein
MVDEIRAEGMVKVVKILWNILTYQYRMADCFT